MCVVMCGYLKAAYNGINTNTFVPLLLLKPHFNNKKTQPTTIHLLIVEKRPCAKSDVLIFKIVASWLPPLCQTQDGESYGMEAARMPIRSGFLSNTNWFL